MNTFAVQDNSNVKIFTSERFGRVKTILNDDGSISINAEDAARGFGWIQIQNKNGRQYSSIRWETVNAYCEELGFQYKLSKDDYIPEPLFYMLGMKANNTAARDYQKWLAMEVLPSLRKSGTYSLKPAETAVQTESVDESGLTQLSPELKAIFSLDKRTVDVSSRVVKLENNMTIDYSQQEELRSLASKRVIEVLGGKEAPAYKELGKRTFVSFWNDYKRILNVNSYRNTSVKKYDYARQTITEWQPSRELALMIKGANAALYN